MKQKCARWGCNKDATYEKPLCYEHWQQWEAWELEECNRCHYFYDDVETMGEALYGGVIEEFGYPIMCDECLTLKLIEDDKITIPEDGWIPLPKEFGQGTLKIKEPEKRPVLPHADIKRPIRYIYILKLSDASFYIGQTMTLTLRLQEHKDGQEEQTKGKNPRLVYFEGFEGDRKNVNKREDELTIDSKTAQGRRKIRKLIEDFRIPLRLLDLEA